MCEPIWFKMDAMIDTTELYILILVYVTLILIQSHGYASCKHFCANYLPKLLIDWDRIWRVLETY